MKCIKAEHLGQADVSFSTQYRKPRSPEAPSVPLHSTGVGSPKALLKDLVSPKYPHPQYSA